jgi:hypothetical protein
MVDWTETVEVDIEVRRNVEVPCMRSPDLHHGKPSDQESGNDDGRAFKPKRNQQKEVWLFFLISPREVGLVHAKPVARTEIREVRRGVVCP